MRPPLPLSLILLLLTVIAADVSTTTTTTNQNNNCSLLGVDRPQDYPAINVNSTDISFVLDLPFVVHRIILLVKPFVEEYETPLQFRISTAVDVGLYSVAAAYDPVALEHGGRVQLSEKHRVYDSEHCTPEAIKVHSKVAILFGFAYIVPILVPKARHVVQDYMTRRFNGTLLAPYLQMNHDASFDACNNLRIPWGLARCILDEIVEYLDASDGWNAKGTLGNRTWNVRPFADFDYTDSHGNQYTAYKVKQEQGTPPKFWKPLVDADGLGYFRRQEHVTPYIGLTGKLYGFGNATDQCKFLQSRRAPVPDYDSIFGRDMDWVLEQTRIMANSEEKQMLVEAFDRKMFSLFLFAFRWAELQQFDNELDFWKFKASFSMIEYNAIVLVWREKIRYNRVRPTSIAQGRPDHDLADTYAGVPGASSHIIPVNQWEPYIRVMPHAEYPSGSACMCQAFVDLMVHVSGGHDDIVNSAYITNLRIPAGSSRVFPGRAHPSTDFFKSWPKWSDMAASCFASRTDGGMHFNDSIVAGQNLCAGFAHLIVEKMDRLVAGNASTSGGGGGGGGLLDHGDREVHVCSL